MPVQDNEQPKKADEQFFENDEDKRRQAVLNSQESNTPKPQKLLPFLNAKAEFHQSRIETLNEKIATRESKIERNERKIAKLSAKADKLEDRNTMLKNSIGRIPFVKIMIESNEKKIAAIKNEKIPKRQAKIKKHQNKIERYTDKRDKIEHKLNRVIALNDTIKSFSIGANKERREVFSAAMDKLNAANTDCLVDKLNVLQEQKEQLLKEYQSPQTPIADRYRLQDKIDNVSKKIADMGNKINKLTRSENHFKEQSNDFVDAAMNVTSNKISEVSDKSEIGMTELSEAVINEAQTIETMDRSQVAELADNFSYLRNAEMALEDDYNSIDGIINNGSKAELEATKKELSETLDAMKEIAGNKYMMESIREDVAQDIPNVEKQLDAVNKALESFPEQAVPSADDKGKINPDYYKSLPKAERHIESMSEKQAEKVIVSLATAGIAFSAVNRAKEKTAITVAKKDVPILKSIMDNAMKAITQENTAEKPKTAEVKTINTDFYKSLTKDNRSISVETKENAHKIMEQLENKGIMYSAVERKNNAVAITVEKSNEGAYKSISDNVKNERAAKYINPDFFKDLPKEERATKRMSQEQAEQKISELSAKNIPHSAVLNGNKSAVTVEKKNIGAAFFSRENLKKSAQRISGRKTDKPKTPNKNQGLE